MLMKEICKLFKVWFHKPGDVVFILFLLAAFHYCKGGFVIEYYVICTPTAQLVGEPGPTRLQRVQVNSQ